MRIGRYVDRNLPRPDPSEYEAPPAPAPLIAEDPNEKPVTVEALAGFTFRMQQTGLQVTQSARACSLDSQ